MNGTGNMEDISAETVPAGITYFIRAGDAIKIGFASSLKKRMSSLKTGSAEELEILAAISASDVDEYATHQKFAHLRIRGEWFRAEKELLQFIDYAKVKFGEAEPHKPAPKRKYVPPAPKVDPLISKLHLMRSAHGDDTAIGRRCSNLAQMIPNYRAATDPAQRAYLAAGIERQVSGLQKLGARFN